MVDITDPLVITYVSTEIRPLAEKLVRLNVVLDDVLTSWFNLISPALSAHADGDVLIDGRADDGVSVLTKADIVSFVSQLITIQTQFDGGGVMDVITKPTVRPLIADL